VGHKNLTIGEIEMKTGMPSGKGTFISKLKKPRIKYYDISLFDFSQ
jgi:hypothetical protein